MSVDAEASLIYGYDLTPNLSKIYNTDEANLMILDDLREKGYACTDDYFHSFVYVGAILSSTYVGHTENIIEELDIKIGYLRAKSIFKDLPSSWTEGIDPQPKLYLVCYYT